MSTFPFNLEKKYVRKNYFHAFSPSLLAGRFVTCGFWGCHMWLLTRSLVASDGLRWYKWEPQSIALTTRKHSFCKPKRCKENGSDWQSTTSENVKKWPFSHQNLFHFKKKPVIWGQNSEFSWQFGQDHKLSLNGLSLTSVCHSNCSSFLRLSHRKRPWIEQVLLSRFCKPVLFKINNKLKSKDLHYLFIFFRTFANESRCKSRIRHKHDNNLELK